MSKELSEYQWKLIRLALEDQKEKLNKESYNSTYALALSEQVKDIENLLSIIKD